MIFMVGVFPVSHTHEVEVHFAVKKLGPCICCNQGPGHLCKVTAFAAYNGWEAECCLLTKNVTATMQHGTEIVIYISRSINSSEKWLLGKNMQNLLLCVTNLIL